MSKAARICIDLDIKENAAVELTLHQYQVEHLSKAGGKSLSEMVAAAQLAKPDFVCAHCGPTNPLKGGEGMPGMANSTAKYTVAKEAAAAIADMAASLPKVDKVDGKRQVIASSGAAPALIVCCRCSCSQCSCPRHLALSSNR